MSKIDLDLTSRVNIEAQKANSFELDMEIKNEDGTNYNFQNQILVFTIYDSDNTVLKILTSDGTIPFYLNNETNGVPGIQTTQFARALSNLVDCDLNNFTYRDNWEEFVYALNVPLLNGSMGGSPIVIIESNAKIHIPYLTMHLNQGSFKYNIKIASDLIDVYDINNNKIDAYFKNSSTWMSGKFTIV